MAFFRSGGFRILLGLALVLGIGAGAAGAWIYVTLLRDLPDLRSIEDFEPPLVSIVLDRNGRPVGEFYTERRRLVAIDEIPRHAKLAFVAAEDNGFFEHKGIDYKSVIRAAWANLRGGGIKQGASTITQQMVKGLLLTPERTFERKFREMILARRIEQNFSKDEILYLYVNLIYFGHGAWGIGEAARDYFGKTVSELSVSESAMLAGLPQRPSAYSPYASPEAAEARRLYVLGRMFEDEIIDRATYEAALIDLPVIRPPAEREDYAVAGYFTEEVRRYLFDRLGGEKVLTGGLRIETTLDLDLQRTAVQAVREGLETHDRRSGYRGPLRTVAESEIESEIAKLGLENELPREPDPGEAETASAETSEEALVEDLLSAETPEVPFDETLLGVVTAVDTRNETASVTLAPGIDGVVEVSDVRWARVPNPRKFGGRVRHISKVFAVGDVTRFVRLPDKEKKSNDSAANAARVRLGLQQSPIVQGALLSMEVGTGDVIAMVGGYDFENSEFNRAVQGLRQPGSAFKPFIYGAALTRTYTPVSTLWDRPAVYEDPISGFVWRPQNYGRKFYGPMPMRTALARSVNNATVHLFRDVGVDYVIDYARRLGIQAPLRRDLSLALGSSSVTLLELTTAYAVFPNRGRRVVPRFITRVTDRHGQVLLEDIPLGTPPPPVLKPLEDENAPKKLADNGGAEDARETPTSVYPDGEILPTDQIISEAAAYLMCDLLKGVVFDPDGTGWRLKDLKRPVAGKTGTTNDQADAWFMGFSPEVVTGVWVGHDESKVLGKNETGSRAAAPIWVKFMRAALSDRPVRDFEVPDQIVFQRIDRSTGLLADSTSKDAYFQPFLENTEPTETASTASSATDTRRALREDVF